MKRQVHWHRRIVPIHEMTNGHLLNVIALINRCEDEDTIKKFPKYKELVKEAVRRKLLSIVK